MTRSINDPESPPGAPTKAPRQSVDPTVNTEEASDNGSVSESGSGRIQSGPPKPEELKVAPSAKGSPGDKAKGHVAKKSDERRNDPDDMDIDVPDHVDKLDGPGDDDVYSDGLLERLINDCSNRHEKELVVMLTEVLDLSPRQALHLRDAGIYDACDLMVYPLDSLKNLCKQSNTIISKRKEMYLTAFKVWMLKNSEPGA
jgi:hypothetical protein